MVVACCRFLCYFCRTGRVNQRAMFEHLGYLLDNSCMLLCTTAVCHFTLKFNSYLTSLYSAQRLNLFA